MLSVPRRSFASSWASILASRLSNALTGGKDIANDMVQKMADHDSQSGPEWETQINDYLAASRK